MKAFTINNIEYRHNEETNRYSKVVDGKTTRIGKAEYDAAADLKFQQDMDNSYERRTAWDIVDDYVYDLVYDATIRFGLSNEESNDFLSEIGKDAKMINEIATATDTMTQDQFDAYLKGLLTKLVPEDTTESHEKPTEEAEDVQTGESTPEPEKPEEAKKKAKRKPRKGKNVTTTVWYDPTLKELVGEGKGEALHLTGKQVEFLKHLPDTCFWDHGLESAVWVDCLCDEIGGEFSNKPMTVGAMVSTLREKGMLDVGESRVNGKKAKYVSLTEKGQAVAKFLGVK